MRKLSLLLTLICFTLISCKTKEAIIPIEEFASYTSGRTTALPKNIYFKDINGVYQKYSGRWSGDYNGNKFELEITEYKEWQSEKGDVRYDKLFMQYKVINPSGAVLRNTLNLPLKIDAPYIIKGQYFNEYNNYNLSYIVKKHADCSYYANMAIGLINNDTQLELFIYPMNYTEQKCGDVVIDPLFPTKGEPALILNRI